MTAFGPKTIYRPLWASDPLPGMAISLLHRWRSTVARRPEALALIDTAEERIWNRRELAGAGTAWATAHASGRRLVGRRVLLSEPNGPSWFAAFLGLLEAGAIPVSLDSGEPPLARAAAAASAQADWQWREGRLQPIDPKCGEAGRSSAVRDVCLVKLTSGSSGRPRAFAFTSSQMAADGAQICATMEIVESDLNLGVIPFGHSYGLGNLVVPLLLQGTGIVCASSPLPHALAEVCQRWKPTVFPAVPPLIRALAQSEVPATALRSLRSVISAGAALDPAVAALFSERFGLRVHGFYGSSETGGITYDSDGAATLTGRSVGHPLVGVKISVGRGGRFTVRSAAVKSPGSHSPGDRGRFSAEGEWVLLGRADRTVKLGGRRLDLSEVEAALRGLPGVKDAHVALVGGREPFLAAAVHTVLAPAAIRRELRGSLATWKIPARIVPLSDFPVTARGKVDTRRLSVILDSAGDPSKEPLKKSPLTQ